MATRVVTGGAEACLQRLRWWLGRSSWRHPFHWWNRHAFIFMSIAVRKNHLPGIGAHSVEKGLKINIHTITHLKYIVLLFNMWRERHIFHTIVTTHNRTTSEEPVGVIYNLTWLSMSTMVSQERFKVFAMKHLTHCGLKLFPCQVTPWLASRINR